ncbi:MAG: 4Fe-4S dicluster domain-containing protein [Planctomycetes bacterium]|nr:4Fe-4S dicluster domain-containing protein [Planctomycetota bacterium]
MGSSEVTREIYWNIPSILVILHYAIFLGASAIFLFGVYKHYRLWRLGQPAHRFNNYPQRIWKFFVYVILQRGVLRRFPGGLIHGLIFFGFATLYVGTLLVLVEADLGIKFLHGPFYEYFSVIMDLAGLAVILGLVLAFIRRYVIRSKDLDNTFDDLVSLALIMVILITGFLMEGFRINMTELNTNPEWMIYSPAGTFTAWLLRGMNLTDSAVKELHTIIWFVHSTLVVGFIAYIPFSKLWHIFSSPLNIFFSKDEHKGNLPKIDIENAESFGVNTLKDFTWKDLLDLDACTQCGRCQTNCPTHVSEKPLSPKKLILDLKNHLFKEGRKLQHGKPNEKSTGSAHPEYLAGTVISDDTIWACTTCHNCSDQCPVLIEQMDKIMELRRYLVLSESKFPTEVTNMFKNMETNGNPWPVGWEQRSNWTKGLEVPVLGEAKKETDLLFWVGCAGATDDRNIKVAQALVNIFKKAGVDFAIMGNEERCCGDPARRIGNEYLFQMLAEENIEKLKKLKFKRIITYCPHCYNTLKNEYRQFGGEFEVIHHSEFLKELIQTNRLKMNKPLKQTVTYHDSCYLGRYNNIYQPPREILNRIPGVTLKEMKRCQANSFCCGGGGGRMWMEEKLGQRINQIRTQEAIDIKAQIIGTACPYCLTMLSDGIKEKEASGIQAQDLAELVNEAME